MKFVCPVCKKQVIDSNWLDIHISNETRIQCPECHCFFVVYIQMVLTQEVMENKFWE